MACQPLVHRSSCQSHDRTSILGQGFYAFTLSTDGIRAATNRSIQSADRITQAPFRYGFGFVLIVSIRSGDFQSLSRKNFNRSSETDYVSYVNNNRSGGNDSHSYSNYDVVSGAVANRDRLTGSYFPNYSKYPNQFAFKTPNAISKLKIVGIAPSPSTLYET